MHRSSAHLPMQQPEHTCKFTFSPTHFDFWKRPKGRCKASQGSSAVHLFWRYKSSLTCQSHFCRSLEGMFQKLHGSSWSVSQSRRPRCRLPPKKMTSSTRSQLQMCRSWKRFMQYSPTPCLVRPDGCLALQAQCGHACSQADQCT